MMVDFNNNQKYSLLSKMGYTGPAEGPMMEAYLASNPGAAAKMGKFTRALQKRQGMSEGGVAGTPTAGSQLTEALIKNPADLTVQAPVEKLTETPGTTISQDVGQVEATPEVTIKTATAAPQVEAPKPVTPESIIATTVAPEVKKVTEEVKTVKGEVKPEATVKAEQQTTSSIADMQADQGTAYIMSNPVKREIQEGELLDGSSVDFTKVKDLTESIQAAEATPTKQATVQGQLEVLMKGFEGGKTPAWAAGAMRTAMGTLAARGLGASSLAGQAVIQAAMEAATPIAQADAKIVAEFESQNLSNRQQAAMLAAEQRATFLGQDFDQKFQTRVLNAAKINDIANQNFTAEQNIALENSRAVNTMNIANLNAKNAMTLAKAAALADLDIANLNNRQQAAVNNANAFLQMDMQNLDNEQQTELFRAKANIDALLTDTAAENAAKQFNASSKNQADQFFSELSARVNMFNTEQKNAMEQFNTGEVNAASKFNAQMEAARKQFNANSSLVIAQANAVWRQNISTINTAAQNESNMEMARNMNALTAKALDEIWQKERDAMAFAFTANESEKDRALDLMLSDKRDEITKWSAKESENSAKWSALVQLAFGDW
jgi:hypothetical protein